MNKYRLSLILPAYNEESNIQKIIKAADICFQKEKAILDYEIVIVDDGSQDKTHFLLEECKKFYSTLRVITHKKNKGYGKALISGILKSSYPLLFIMDADGQFNSSDLSRALKYCDQYDAVIGYRQFRKDSLYRIILGKLFSFLVSRFFKLKFKDINCGFKLIKKSILKDIKLISHNGLIYTEMFYKLMRKNYKIKQIRVDHFFRKFGKETGGNFKVIFKSFKEMIFLWWKLIVKAEN